jgi:ABC-2 type transport system ATP-binding protein
MPNSTAIEITELAYRYGDHEAIRGLSLDISQGEIFALLGPNGSGKTTLFRLLSTLIPPQTGEVRIFGNDLRRHADQIRAQLGVVFQAPSVDKKLTVRENVNCHGYLYGLSGSVLRARADEMLSRFGLTDRGRELVQSLSGGLRRRVELAMGMLHQPRLLLLDEPSTGLDPGARSDVWQYLQQVRTEQGVTVLLTTHLLEEAERADRIAIMHAGKLAALGTPAELQSSIGGDTITIRTSDAAGLAAEVMRQFQLTPQVVDGSVRLEQPNGHELVPRLVEAFRDRIDAITLGKPTLEDVFIHATGHRFWLETTADTDTGRNDRKKRRGHK